MWLPALVAVTGRGSLRWSPATCCCSLARTFVLAPLFSTQPPHQACWTSGLSFSIGAVVPLLAGAFIPDWRARIVSVCVVTVFMLICIGALGAHLGGASHGKGALRVLVGGGAAMGVT